jgi:hypothetical protein
MSLGALGSYVLLPEFDYFHLLDHSYASAPIEFRHRAVRHFMRTFLVILAATSLISFQGASGADRNSKPTDEKSLRGYMAGEYDLIGRKPDLTTTYTGHVTLRDENGVLQVTRTIGGKTDKCTAQFDTVAGADRIPVLRMHFHFDGKEYDATYRWQSDPDNYPRFTGYVYLADTKSPGLEALFPIHK